MLGILFDIIKDWALYQMTQTLKVWSPNVLWVWCSIWCHNYGILYICLSFVGHNFLQMDWRCTCVSIIVIILNRWAVNKKQQENFCRGSARICKKQYLQYLQRHHVKWYFKSKMLVAVPLLHKPLSVFRCNVTSEWQGGNEPINCVSTNPERILFFLVYVKQAKPECRVNLPLTAYLRISFTNHNLNQHLRASAPSEPTLPWIMWQFERPLTLQLSGAQAFLKPLHLILQEADMPHHVLRRVYLHGNISWGGRSWYRLVQLLLKDSSLENKRNTLTIMHQMKW